MGEVTGANMSLAATVNYLVMLTKCSHDEASEAAEQAEKHGQVSFRNVAITANRNGTWTVKKK